MVIRCAATWTMQIRETDVPDMPSPPDWLIEAVYPLPFDEPHKWPDKVRRALLADDAAKLLWRRMHGEGDCSEKEDEWLCQVLLYFRDHPRANDKNGWFRMDDLCDGPRY